MAYTGLRIHPAIGIARVGNSEEYYLGPESPAGMPLDGQDGTGGLPIRPGTEDTAIASTELRDASGKLKRQAARFRIYQYAFDAADGVEAYPLGRRGAAAEVTIGSMVDGKIVKDIIWTVHLANKKANSWEGGDGMAPFENQRAPALRNPHFGEPGSPHFGTPADPLRLKLLVIDPGPRSVQATRQSVQRFDAATPPSCAEAASGAVRNLPDYPVSFPRGGQPGAPAQGPGAIIASLGAITTEKHGRLLVLGGYGKACGFDAQGNYSAAAVLHDNVNNDNWFDDVADGPVTAMLLFADGTARSVEGSAWVISSDPSYAPQTANVVSLWDDLYCTWLEKMALRPAVYADGSYQTGYRSNFSTDVQPILRAASLQRWTTSLPPRAIKEHDLLGKMKAAGLTYPIMNFIRHPDQTGAPSLKPQMPLSLGDAGSSLLTLTRAQYFFMDQWAHGQYVADGGDFLLGAGEALDRTVLFNCLGGRYSPGIEMGFIVRDPGLYRQAWRRHDGGGPFRINAQHLDYPAAVRDRPFLGAGYMPLRGGEVQPGDVSKFMALPWHTDYNSCATHLPDPNPGGTVRNNQQAIDAATAIKGNGYNTLLYSSWPAQRPVAVYTYDDVVANGGELATPRYSVRGKGTRADGVPSTTPENAEIDRPAMHVGRYQDRAQFLLNWHRIGVVVQSTAIARKAGEKAICKDYYLEVESLFDSDESNLVEYWRNTAIDKVYRPKPQSKPKP
ncbi:LodA/GoxA family CTQ-dependent oxidase [Janthinobacterium sp. EB271-G4-7A]|uniref:LodA/GoxA family CTQ-dependent oxidase n=1 Tax=Janthinobacterium sp. EB271-G4-7A TaxID=2775056 RepID=UPI001E3EA6B4|nr:LodA/GoxA family CTQ-dependent oxidase [Janthinobacterium sp. EB271-G4-7A]MCC7698365.1 LodA/GoxA family CTQ-dependent oxidase [Janthinobacterium sp. EB271-G4-7A]